jgi:hypothetical protein
MKKGADREIICSMKTNASDGVFFQNLIDHNYNHNWVFGDVSAVSFPVGNHSVYGYHIYDHFNITIHYPQTLGIVISGIRPFESITLLWNQNRSNCLPKREMRLPEPMARQN